MASEAIGISKTIQQREVKIMMSSIDAHQINDFSSFPIFPKLRLTLTGFCLACTYLYLWMILILNLILNIEVKVIHSWNQAYQAIK